MRKCGFSLIEIVVVMLVLAIGLTTIILVLRFSTVQSAGAHFYTVANWLCQERMEEELSIRKGDNGFDMLEAFIPGSPYTEDLGPEFSGYARTTTLSYTDLGGALPFTSDYIFIRVEVSREVSGSSLSMETVVSRYD